MARMVVFSRCVSVRRFVAAAAALATVAGMLVAWPQAASAAPSGLSVSLPAHARPWQTLKTAHRPSTPPKPIKSTSPYTVGKDGEIPALRTRFSSTYERGNAYQTVESTAPVHYKNSAGDWVPIDDTLVKDSSGIASPTADDYSVDLPADLSQPVVSSQGALTVSSQLQDAAAVPSTTSGATATYANALPNVDVAYTVHPDFLEESLKLKSAAAASSYAFSVTLPDGYTLAADPSRALNILNASGDVAGSLPAPVMRDSSTNPDTSTSTNVHYSVSGTAPQYTVTIAADSAWLKDSARVWPVTIDPTVSFGTSLDLGCYIASPGASDGSLCATNLGTDNSLLYGHTAFTRHILLKFGDLTGTSSPIPANAIITDAQLNLKVQSFSNTGVGMNTAMYRIGQAFTSAVTWTTSDGTTSWPAGGNFGSTLIDNTEFTPTTGGSLTLTATRLVDGWVHGSFPNDGMGIQLLNDSGNNTATFYGMANANHPALSVTWQPTVGQQKWVQAYDHQLTDRMDLHVDLGSRNLVLNNTDENLTSPGQAMIVRRTYNSTLAAAGNSGDVGTGWSLNGGTDTGLQITNATVVFTQPGGAPAVFYRNFTESDLTQDDAFDPNASAPGLNATLTRPDSTHYRLSFHASHVLDNFTLPAAGAATAALTSVQDRAHDTSNNGGNTTTWTVTSGQATKVTDTTGQRSVGFSYTSGRITSASETLAGGATGRSWSYHYDGSGNLTSYTDPAGKTTLYCYTGSLITGIVTPRGTSVGNTCSSGDGTGTTLITYDTNGAVTSLRYENPSGVTDDFVYFDQTVPPTTSHAATVTQTDTYNNTTTYTIDVHDRVTKAIDPLGNTRSTSYNANNDATAAVSPNNNTGNASDPATTATYDGNNSLTQIALPQSTVGLSPGSVQLGYSGSGTGGLYLPATSTDDRQNNSSYTYSSGAVQSITGDTATGGIKATQRNYYEGDTPTGESTEHCGPSGGAAYPGALCDSRDPLWTAGTTHRTQYRYDSMGELTSIIPPAPGNGRPTPATTTLGYDAYSRATSSSDGKSQDTSYTYDALDRLTKITYDDGTSTTYTYDEDGDRTAAIDKNSSGSVTHQDTYTFDTQDRLSTETNGSAGVITLTYDANSNLASYDDDGGTVTYGYDAAGGLTSIAEPGGDCSSYSLPSNPPPLSSNCILFALDKNGNRALTVYPGNNVQQTSNYDAAGRLHELSAAVTGTTLYDYTYSYATSSSQDSAHLAQITNNDGSFRQYAYDGLTRLTTARAVSSGGSVTSRNVYCYDKGGNRTSSLTGTSASCPATPDITYDGANEALTNTDGTTYSYDLDGNLTHITPGGTGSGTGYTYNDRNQQTAVTTSSGTTTRTYAGAENIELLSVTSGGSTTSLLNSPLGISAITSGGSTTYVTRDPSGALIGYRTGAGSGSGVDHRYYLTDERGSVTTVVDPDGTVITSYRYDPYGAVTAGSPDTFGYISGYTDTGDAASIKLGGRYYTSTNGTFIQTDPQMSLTHPGRYNPYTYAGGDPVNSLDPSGAGWLDDVGSALDSVADTIDNTISETAAEFVTSTYEAAVGCAAGAYAATESGAAETATIALGPEAGAAVEIGGCALGGFLNQQGGELG